MKRPRRNLLGLVVGLGIVGGVYLTWSWIHSTGAVTYSTEPVARGDLLVTISATGSLEPEEAVDVGAQVAGQISQFGTEDGKPVDRRSFVKKGDLLAQIDPSLYKMDLESAQAQLAQSHAQLAQSKANVVKAEADIQQMEAKKTQAEQDWNRAQSLVKDSPGALAAATYDSYRAAYLTAVANVASARAAKEQALAAIQQAEAAIQQTQASVNRAQRNLDYCTITSPVDGVIIDRRVNIGQTVVSSLNAPSLFLIARDLTRMQIWVSVNEADIGSIHDGQSVTFTVDARPGITFHGTVTKVRFDASMTQNVVTYPVEVSAMNPDGLLYPYMTADVHFQVNKRTDVLEVPNSALAYAPLTVDEVAPESRAELERMAQRSSSQESSEPQNHSRPTRDGRRPAASQPGGGGKVPDAGAPGAQNNHDKGLLWVRQGEFLRPVPVRVGMTDGTVTEVAGPELKEGLEVVVSEQRKAPPQGGAASPFLPQFRRR
jgi:HlyD family secretion protein